MKKELFIAGGCFWGVEAFFSRIKGILCAQSYYINGGFEGVSYKEVCTTSKHVEAVCIEYDDSIISEETIWDFYLKIIDPYSLNKQGGDQGTQYRVGIYTNNEKLLNKFKELNNHFVKKEGKKNYLEFLPVSDQTLAEEYHQQYLMKNPMGYCHINLSAIPDKYLKEEFKNQ